MHATRYTDAITTTSSKTRRIITFTGTCLQWHPRIRALTNDRSPDSRNIACDEFGALRICDASTVPNRPAVMLGRVTSSRLRTPHNCRNQLNFTINDRAVGSSPS